ncbi:unnamed protein product [Prorocentrum cordatum]|uniref:Fungal lipase-type domain-containing protein n=1 Tax=Prorocentrum cordatum TaxID=2364126 RepID=A0ABN9T0X7_9DINO|nr:unnamed protein product [Polarella glacialis]
MVAASSIALALAGVLISLSVVSSIQKHIDWFPNTIWFHREERPPALVVDHLVSRMRLEIGQGPNASSRPSGATGGVSYAACGHLWHGLSVLDYSLLSLASYFDAADPSLPPLLESMFPPGHGLSGRLRPSGPPERPAVGRGESRLRWLEVEMRAPGLEKPVLVIAIRGTDPIRASDYVEDIRMWTEPVCISILSTIFPTVRAWPRQTAEAVIKGIHEMLDSLGLPDDKWSYTELVHRVRRIPREPYSQVVLTGHSLGGGTATVVAALTQLPVVGITPPGIYWSLAKHNYFFGRNGTDAPLGARRDAGISNWMHHQSLTLVVENDWVNGIFDDHGGLVQMMTCDRSEESLQLGCHMLEGTICHLLSSCGDVHGRFTACSHEFLTDMNDQGQSTSVRHLLEVLGEVLSEHQKPRLAALAAWIERPQLPDLGIPKGKVLLLLGFLVLLLAIGGATEELLLL